MKGLSQLAGEMSKLVEDVSELKKNELMDLASQFIKTRKTIDGTAFARDTSPKWGFDGSLKVSRESKKNTKDGIVYSARLRFAPGGGGGAGIGMDPVSSNYLYTMLGGDKKALDAICKAFHAEVLKVDKKMGESLRKWLSKPENFMHHIVGYGNRENYVVKDVMLKEVKYEPALMDPTRRKWPASWVEIWCPVTAEVIITVKEK